MFLSDLQKKDIVSINDGRNLGRIVDVEVNEDGLIINLIVLKKKLFWKFFKEKEDNFIPLKNISRIGEDVILVKDEEQ